MALGLYRAHGPVTVELVDLRSTDAKMVSVHMSGCGFTILEPKELSRFIDALTTAEYIWGCYRDTGELPTNVAMPEASTQ